MRRFSSLASMFRASCDRFADRPAFTHLGDTLSFSETAALSRDFGAYLQKVLGLARGERIAVMLPNSLQYPVAVFGALRAGLSVVNVNPMYTASELSFQLRDAGASAILVLENFAHTVEQALPETGVKHVIVTQIGDLFPAIKRSAVNFIVRHFKKPVPAWTLPQAVTLHDALHRGSLHALEEPPLHASDTAFVQYTGGTTGRPKGAELTHGSMVANVEQTIAWIGRTLLPGEEVVITALPLYHVFALTANLLVFTRLGAENVLVTDPRDMASFIKTLQHTPFTAMTGVNTLFSALLDAEGFDEVAAARRAALKVVVAGGMALQRRVAERWQAAMGVPLVEGYGLTEASPILCANRVDLPEYTGKLGLPVPSTEIAMLDDDGHEVPQGEVGEICGRGPQLMKGYWNKPEETAKVITPDGWLRTGDLGRIDERGYVEFVDRKKDIIVVSGFKAFPAEIEDVARLHPGVKDAGVVGVPDERTGEAVALFVVPSDPSLTVDAVRAHCEQHLTAYKRPKHIALRDALPMTPLGKVLRRQLRQEILAPAPPADRATSP
ncbi:AMP-binding protein [Ideonella sp. YS5]|uniref:AMP-binding protein n=1 Tax=Ideonella sp. YS5 TaxID=3453714 RepID=UPI003EEDF1CB